MKFYRRAIDGSWPAVRDASVKRKIGQLLLSYGAPRQAADVFRNMAQADHRDAAAYVGLGEAELAMENYQDASDAFQKALERNPSNQASKQRLEATERVLALDPNARGLRAAARYARSKELLQATLTRLDQCKATSQSGDGGRKALMGQPRRGEYKSQF